MYIGRTMAVTSDGQSYNADIDDNQQVSAWAEKVKLAADEEPAIR